jgi:hypothetical protein
MPKDPEALKAELALLEAEAAFVKKKGTAKGVTRDDKLALRALRAEYRAKWRGPPKDGGAAPEAYNGSAGVA